MPWVIGILLVGMALFSIVGVLWFVMREHHETEEWYVPPAPGSQPTSEEGE